MLLLTLMLEKTLLTARRQLLRALNFQADLLCPEKIPHSYKFYDLQGCEGESSYAVNNMPASVEMVYR